MLFLIIAFLLAPLVFNLKILAQPPIVINEFLVEPDGEQQVELYNTGSSPVDISGWFIDDDGGSQKYTITSGTILAPGEFKSFKSGLFNLNRSSPDTVRLINNTDTFDSKSYEQSPGSGKSLGRQPDGSDNWLVFSTPTWDKSNNSSIGQPLPTPSPSPTPAPQQSPPASSVSSKSPTPTHTPKTSQSPTPTKSPTITDKNPKIVLGEKEENQNRSPSPSPKQESPSPSPSKKPTPSSPKIAAMITGAGIILIGLSFAFYLWYKKNLGSPEKEEKNDLES